MATKVDDAPMLALIETPDVPMPTPNDQARIVLLSPERFDDFYERMKAETDAHVADTSSERGRKATIALSARVTKTKTAITAAAKGLTEEWRQKTNSVNAARRPIEDRLSALAEDVRRPVTKWEAAENARVEANRQTIADIRGAATIEHDDTSASVEARGRKVHDIQFDAAMWTAAELDDVVSARSYTVKALVAARDRLRQEEDDRAELAKLRAQAAEREAREAAERAVQEEAERAARLKRDAEDAERRRIEAAEQAKRDEAQRIADAEKAAAERASQEAANAAARERADRDAEHTAALQVERDRAAAVERERQAERQREAAAQAQRDRIATEDAKRAKNRAHVSAVMTEAKAAIMSCGADEAAAKTIVVAIKGGLVPHVGISF